VEDGLASRHRESVGRLEALRAAMRSTEPVLRDVACIYVTGSYGRGDSSNHSDLDAFIVGAIRQRERDDGAIPERLFSRLDEIVVTADLIRRMDALGFPRLSKDGEYFRYYSTIDLTSTLGTQDDDARNTLTARLLLLLESQALIGQAFYEQATEAVVDAYWRDYHDHKTDFMPAFLFNDILRMWRTFCVNYEAKTQDDPATEKAKRALKNYKLKHSRMMTCYSGLAYLSAIHAEKGSVTPDDALRMVRQTPLERLDNLPEFSSAAHASRPVIRDLQRRYLGFLELTGRGSDAAIDEFLDKDKKRMRMQQAKEFGDAMFTLMREIGDGSPLFRMLVV